MLHASTRPPGGRSRPYLSLREGSKKPTAAPMRPGAGYSSTGLFPYPRKTAYSILWPSTPLVFMVDWSLVLPLTHRHVGLAVLVLGRWRRIGQSEDVIRQPSPEPLVVFKLLEELHVVVEHGSHHALQGLVMLDPGVLPVGVLPGIAVGGVPSNLGWNLLRNEAANPILVLPGDIPELVIEGLEKVLSS